MGSFLSTASKRVTDVRSFLRDAAGGNSIKYVAEKGAKHLIYIPPQTTVKIGEDGQEHPTKEIIAISGNVHEWQSPDGKYKATVCMKDVVRYIDNNDPSLGTLNDGVCPFCDRVTDGWDIYRYRKELEEASCKLTGEDRKKHLEKTISIFADERKAKDARTYMYILVVKYRQGTDGGVVMGSDGLPEYELKVMKLSQSRVDKLQQQIANAGTELPGSEMMFEYPNTDDRRLQISQSTTAPVFPNNMMVTRYPALINKINEDVAKFDFEGIEKSFPEWAGMGSVEAKKVTDAMFEQWDKYKVDAVINPSARYMEYLTDKAVTTPQLGGNVIPGAVIPNAVPAAPTLPNAPVMPGMAPSGIEAPVIPTIPDANAVFGASAAGVQIN